MHHDNQSAKEVSGNGGGALLSFASLIALQGIGTQLHPKAPCLADRCNPRQCFRAKLRGLIAMVVLHV